MKKTLITTFFTIFLLSSCSKESLYDKKKAILAFADSNSLEIDEKLAKTTIKIPKQTKNGENISFTPQNNEEFLDNIEKKWTALKPFLDNRFVFAPIFHQNKVFLLDPKGVLSSYYLENGKKIFKKRIFSKKYLKNYQNPKIALFKDKIFAITGTNEVKSVNATTGEVIWSKKIISLTNSTPISDGKLVFISTVDDKTYALKTNNGDLAWVASAVARPTAILGASRPIIDGNKLIVTYASGEIYALNKNNGELLWSQNLNLNRATDSDFYLNDIDSTPIIKGSTVFAVGNGGLMMAINKNSGDYLWKKEIASISDFWAASGFLFVVNNDGKLICLSQKAGKIKYIKQIPSFKKKKTIYNAIIMAGDKLLISDRHGRIIIANPQNGEIEQIFKTGQKISHRPIIIDGKIYFHSVGSWIVNLLTVS